MVSICTDNNNALSPTVSSSLDEAMEARKRAKQKARIMRARVFKRDEEESLDDSSTHAVSASAYDQNPNMYGYRRPSTDGSTESMGLGRRSPKKSTKSRQRITRSLDSKRNRHASGVGAGNAKLDGTFCSLEDLAVTPLNESRWMSEEPYGSDKSVGDSDCSSSSGSLGSQVPRKPRRRLSFSSMNVEIQLY